MTRHRMQFHVKKTDYAGGNAFVMMPIWREKPDPQYITIFIFWDTKYGPPVSAEEFMRLSMARHRDLMKAAAEYRVGKDRKLKAVMAQAYGKKRVCAVYEENDENFQRVGEARRIGW